MTKGEVAGLQSLALAHGGSLTINPHTGLVEAGFLSSFLPMLVGAGLSIASGGALTPLMAAGIMGGGTALATGSLRKGLMAGLGAYGGAGVAGGLMGAGAAAGLEAGVGTAGAGAASETAATQAALQQNALTNIGVPSNAAAGTGSMSFAPNTLTPQMLGQSASLPMSVPVGTGQLVGGVPQMANAVPLPAAVPPFSESLSQMGRGFTDVTSSGAKALAFAKDNAYPLGAMGLAALGGSEPAKFNATPNSPGMIRPYTYNSVQNEPENPIGASYTPGQSTRERNYMTNTYTAGTPYAAPGPEYKMAEGGVASLTNYSYNPDTHTYSGSSTPGSFTATGNPITDAVNKAASTASQNSMEANAYTYNPVTQQYAKVVPDSAKAAAAAAPVAAIDNRVLAPSDYGYGNTDVFANGGSVPMRFAAGGSNLGGYSDGGQLLRGPGDGVSDSIPAMIGQKQHARLADGEFVVPARIVSELGNGSTEAGARQLYAMMDRVQNARKKAMGKDKVATDTRAAKLLPV